MEETKEVHKCENPGCSNNAVKQYKSGWCCSTHCALSLLSKKSPNAHALGKGAKGHHKCNKCELEFNTKRELHQHKVDVHYGNEIYTCICGKEFHSKRSLGTHKQRCPEVLKQNGQLLDKYVCVGCGKEFDSKTVLQAHIGHCEKYEKIPSNVTHSSKYWNEEKQMYVCECGREFANHQSLNAHFSMCLKHKSVIGAEVKIADSRIRRGQNCNFAKCNFDDDDEFKAMHRKTGRSLHNNLKSGKTTNVWLGRKHKPESKQKIREGYIRYLEKCLDGSSRAYDVESISVINQISQDYGWNLQHAENGGEVQLFGYFVDAYDKEKNIVLEYDEAFHYEDAFNNVLKTKDIERQNYIISNLSCDFYRYNEVTKELWKVSLQ